LCVKSGSRSIVHQLKRKENAYEASWAKQRVPGIGDTCLLEPVAESHISERAVPTGARGEFLCAIFNLWLDRDIGRVKIQVFEEAAPGL
jgi:sulfatase maturation enzyme AslB (radical SAM superfamily)